MFKVASTLVLIAWLAHAQQMKKAPVQAAPVADGKAMFHEYCTVCHGSDGKGDGPVANALKKRPADLTQLTRKNNGTFPELRVMNFITGNDVVAAHGRRDMPVWGELFRSLDPNAQEVVMLRVWNLMDYVKSLQAQ